MTLINIKDLEAHLWHAAHIITGPIDASDYKTYIFPILFFKRICDVYDEEFIDAMEQVGDEELAKGEMFHRIQIPQECHWKDVFAETKDIDMLKAVCQERLSKYEQPHYYIYTNRIPTTETDKPARAKAMEMAESDAAK